jgi:hypothetical protein
LIRVTHNKIKNELKTYGITARKLERKRKKQVDALQKAKEFVPIHLLKAIPDPELSTTEADINLQLRERLISTSAEIDLDLDAILLETQATSSNTKDKDCPFASQADYMSILGFDNKDSMDWNYLDANKDADINLF